MITQLELKELINYNPETGIFTWNKPRKAVASKKQINNVNSLYGYMQVSLNYKKYFLHRLAWLYVYGYFPKNEIDHINNNRSDNRIENLREATRSENSRNTRLNVRNTSGFKGISWFSRLKKWRAYININKKQITLGYYSDIEIAKKVINEARLKHHGIFANAG